MSIDGPLRTVKVRRPAWEAAMVHSLMSMAALAIVTISCARPAVAEATTLRAAKQYGLGYVQLMIMEDTKLVEKHAQAAGVVDIRVEWNSRLRLPRCARADDHLGQNQRNRR